MKQLPPLLKVRQPINHVSSSPICIEDLEIYSQKLYQFFTKTFFKYFGKHIQEIVKEDVVQEIKLFILMHWNGKGNKVRLILIHIKQQIENNNSFSSSSSKPLFIR